MDHNSSSRSRANSNLITNAGAKRRDTHLRARSMRGTSSKSFLLATIARWGDIC
jgi:hypothetical protein